MCWNSGDGIISHMYFISTTFLLVPKVYSFLVVFVPLECI
jgi:hypothetical protein